MSRSKEDWDDAKKRALKIRSLLRELQGELDDWPVPFNDSGEVARGSIEAKVTQALRPADELIGSCHADIWDDE